MFFIWTNEHANSLKWLSFSWTGALKNTCQYVLKNALGNIIGFWWFFYWFVVFSLIQNHDGDIKIKILPPESSAESHEV